MIKKFLAKNEFSKNAIILMAGTLLAQAVPISIIPILTRLFTPEDFGLLALYGAFVSVLGVVATGRYEIAIMLPKENESAKILLQLSAWVALVVSLIISVPIALWNTQIASLLGNKNVAPWLYLIPVSVFLTGIYQALTYWNNRQKNFKNTAISRLNQSFYQGTSQSGLGVLNISGGLIWGQFIGIFSSVIYLLRKNKSYRIIFKLHDINKLKQQAIKYKKFPCYGILGGLCDAAAVQMPVLILAKFYNSSITGIFSLTFRVLNIPTSIISSAIGQVLFQKIVVINHEEPEKLKPYIVKVFFLLLITYFPVIPILLIWGDDIFAFVFGEQWRVAGAYASYLVFAVAIRFAVSPLSAVFGLEENLKKGAFWQMLYLCTITTTLYLSSTLNIEDFFLVFVIHEIVLYGIYFVLILKNTKALKNRN